MRLKEFMQAVRADAKVRLLDSEDNAIHIIPTWADNEKVTDISAPGINTYEVKIDAVDNGQALEEITETVYAYKEGLRDKTYKTITDYNDSVLERLECLSDVIDCMIAAMKENRPWNDSL